MTDKETAICKVSFKTEGFETVMITYGQRKHKFHWAILLKVAVVVVVFDVSRIFDTKFTHMHRCTRLQSNTHIHRRMDQHTNTHAHKYTRTHIQSHAMLTDVHMRIDTHTHVETHSHTHARAQTH